VGYDDPESPTPGVKPLPTSNTTVEDLRHTISSMTDDNLKTGEGFFPGSEPSQAMMWQSQMLTQLSREIVLDIRLLAVPVM